MPVMSKTEALGFARSGKMKFQKYQTSDLNVRVYGDAAVVSGRLQREPQPEWKNIGRRLALQKGIHSTQ
jgi:hypothetical protein